MDSQNYNMGGELGGDPLVDQITVLFLVLVVVVFFFGYRWWLRRPSGNRDRQPKP
ncbi:hypothetical protein [Inquilinus sp. CA228]|uniref:hypothetical protein n=1 Tax=Inquilinus sp. CA228 TaxID=3455609 RepID=UPI003F8D2C45